MFDREQIKQLYLEGYSSPQIAKKIGCSRAWVQKVLHQFGIKLNRGQGRTIWKTIPQNYLFYLAGLIDGEGAIIYNKPTKNNPYGQPSLQISNTNKKVINWLQKNIGGKVYFRSPKSAGKLSKKGIYIWQVKKIKDLAFLIPLVLPNLIVKKTKAKRLLNILKKQWQIQIL